MLTPSTDLNTIKLGLVTLMASPLFLKRALGALSTAFHHAKACQCKQAFEHVKLAKQHMLTTQQSLTTVKGELPTQDAKKELEAQIGSDNHA